MFIGVAAKVGQHGVPAHRGLFLPAQLRLLLRQLPAAHPAALSEARGATSEAGVVAAPGLRRPCAACRAVLFLGVITLVLVSFAFFYAMTATRAAGF